MPKRSRKKLVYAGFSNEQIESKENTKSRYQKMFVKNEQQDLCSVSNIQNPNKKITILDDYICKPADSLAETLPVVSHLLIYMVCYNKLRKALSSVQAGKKVKKSSYYLHTMPEVFLFAMLQRRTQGKFSMSRIINYVILRTYLLTKRLKRAD